MGAMINRRRSEKDEPKLMTFYMQGRTDAEIGRKCGLHPNSVAAWRRLHGLSANLSGAREKSDNMSELAKDAMAARELGMSYGQFKAKQHDGHLAEKARQDAIFAARKKAKAEREAAEAAARTVPDYGGGFDFEVIGNKEGFF